MLSLRDLQANFSDYITQQKESAILSHINENGLTATRRLQIYHNNVFSSLTEALKATYPTILNLVGEDFFRNLAHQYIKSNPSISGDLHHFGGDLSAFLATLPVVSSLPYLYEVADLEWACHQVFHEADPTPFDFTGLQTLSEEAWEHIRFKLHPASRLLAFQYPILHIWEICQDDKDEHVNLGEGGDKILVIRRQGDIIFEKLSVGEFYLLQAFSNDLILSEACDFALQYEACLTIDACLQNHLGRGTITSFLI